MVVVSVGMLVAVTDVNVAVGCEVVVVLVAVAVVAVAVVSVAVVSVAVSVVAVAVFVVAVFVVVLVAVTVVAKVVVAAVDTVTSVQPSAQLSRHTASLGGSKLPEVMYPANEQVPSPSRSEAAVMLGAEPPKTHIDGYVPLPSQLRSKYR